MKVMCLYTVLMFSVTIALVVLSFMWFSGYSFEEGQENWTDPATGETVKITDEYLSPDCSSNYILISLTLVMIVLVFFLRCRQDSSIFTSAMVSMWLIFLLWSALASKDDIYCNTMGHSTTATVLQIVLHFVWTFITLFLLAIATSSEDGKGSNIVTEVVGEDAKTDEKVDLEDKDGKKVDAEEIYVFPVTKQTLVF